jgi:YD repeat-containing protein
MKGSILAEAVGGGDQGWRFTERVSERDRFGNPTVTVNAQGQETHHHYDLAGRPHYTYTSDGAWSRVLFTTEQSTNLCPAGTRFTQRHSAADNSQSVVCKDTLGREIRQATSSFAWTGENSSAWIFQDTRYDYASRPVWVSEPYHGLQGESAHWTRTFYDEFGRVDSVVLPNGAIERWEYDGLTTYHINALGQRSSEKRNALGEVVARTKAIETTLEETTLEGTTTFEHDALGQLREVRAPLDADTAAKITIDYDPLGNRIWVDDPDKGKWYYHHNALGELLCQIDSNRQATLNRYDSLGRVVQRWDLTDVPPNVSAQDCAGWLSDSGSLNLPAGVQIGSETIWEFSHRQLGDVGDPNEEPPILLRLA